MMEQEHESAKHIVMEVIRLTNHFEPPVWACVTHIALFAGLREFETDLKQHVHLENDVLFPRAIQLEAEIKGGVSHGRTPFLNRLSPSRHRKRIRRHCRERQKSLMLRAWILSGLFFMALPGTLLGFSNLMAISAHMARACPPHGWKAMATHRCLAGLAASFSESVSIRSLLMAVRSFVCRCRVSLFGRPALPCAGLRISTHGTGGSVSGLRGIGVDCRPSVSFRCVAPQAAGNSRREASKGHGALDGLRASGNAGLLRGDLQFHRVRRLALYGSVSLVSARARPEVSRTAGLGIHRARGVGFLGALAAGFLAISKPDVRWFRAACITGCCGCAVRRVRDGEASDDPFGSECDHDCVCTCISPSVRTGLPKIQGIHPSFPVHPSRLSVADRAGSMSIWAAFADLMAASGAHPSRTDRWFCGNDGFAIGPRILPHFAGVQASSASA